MADDRAGKKEVKEKSVKSKEKKKRTGRKHESLKVWNYYEVKDGSVTRKRDNCSRCGPGTFLSEHKDRLYCGRCGFTQFEKKKMESAEPIPESAEPVPKSDEK